MIRESGSSENSTLTSNTWEEDDYIYCDHCRAEYREACPKHGPLILIRDAPANSTGLKDKKYAERTTPPCLRIATSAIKNAGLGVWTAEKIPARCCFGPYKGRELSHPTKRSYGWQIEIWRDGRRNRRFVDSSDSSTSNWMRFVNCARNFQEQNLVAYQFKGEVYYGVLHEIPAHSELYVYYNDECAKELGIDVSRYMDSLENSFEVERFSCEDCDIEFKSPMERDAHAIGCKRATEEVARDGGWAARSRWLDGSATDCTRVRFQCPVCGAEFSQDATLYRHMRVYHEENPFRCAICGLDPSEHGSLPRDTSSLPDNKLEHAYANTQDKRYICDICGLGFSKKNNLPVHLRVHEAHEIHPCGECGAHFSKANELQEHQRRHAREREKSRECDECRPEAIDELSARSASGGQAYHCAVCDEKFERECLLAEHARTHDQTKPFQCTKCSCSFTRKRYLIGHLRMHRGDVTFECDVCQGIFASKRNLLMHKRLHNGERFLQCRICDKRYYNIVTLRNHIRVHTGAKPYKCYICEKKFRWHETMRQHLITHVAGYSVAKRK